MSYWNAFLCLRIIVATSHPRLPQQRRPSSPTSLSPPLLASTPPPTSVGEKLSKWKAVKNMESVTNIYIKT